GDVDPVERLIDVCDAYRAPVEFSCRSGICGLCRVEVLEGQELLLPPVDDELETLAFFDAPPTHRLACQARMRGTEGHVRLRWAARDR
ncbi:MAG TPA: 2Fe-2S iron-sulfur cluster-binding protein, partial [Polyangium sp.]|nr:2Fe-2S iron-sulfur cluster-binding protein [Polyangium sp.]